MAKLSNKKSLTNEEIEATIDELSKKLEILRVRYEQYFIGVEKIAPAVMRMDVVRIMRDLEQINIKNTALKFKLRTLVQKFTSYSTYWNRTLREIEDGTYKRHVDKAKREAARLAQKSGQTGATASKNDAAANPAGSAATKAVADEADEFLASLGLSASRQTMQRNAAPATEQNPGLTPDFGQNPRMGQESSQNAPSLRQRRPVIVSASKAAVPAAQTPQIPQTPAQQANRAILPQTPAQQQANRAILPQAPAPQRPLQTPAPQIPQTPAQQRPMQAPAPHIHHPPAPQRPMQAPAQQRPAQAQAPQIHQAPAQQRPTQTPAPQRPLQTPAPQIPNRAILPQAPRPGVGQSPSIPHPAHPGAGHVPAPPTVHPQQVPGHAPETAPKTPAHVPGRVPARSAIPARDIKPSGLPPLGRPGGLPPKNGN